MMRQRQRVAIVWDGPEPAVGDFVAGRTPKQVWVIRDLVYGADRKLRIDMRRYDGTVPKTAVMHPAARVQPSDPAGPARVRQLATSGPTAVMRADWRDPSDVVPNASRRPKHITGFRTYDPLRRMAGLTGSSITQDHINAADFFREQVDMAAIGLSGRGIDELVSAGFGPQAGFSDAAIANAFAADHVRGIVARITPSLRPLLVAVVLRNQSLNAWCAAQSTPGHTVKVQTEMGRLLAILDILADIYAADIAKAGQAGALPE